ncbi:metal ABC transporter solute-binding protein, Zn/Mn family [Rhodococcus sp. NPDC127528]|uniref:metal ABC transporter solute-binding protein, Zn/Mn family n=1 Tax=unclassified Rhodococcus (in: high G+C Gram-positive bacteria) TaxID=192944 RepID=UPI00363AFF63
MPPVDFQPQRFRRARPRAAGFAAIGLVAVAALGLSACSSASAGDRAANGQRISVVASTNVWGSVAAAVAGDRADVTSIVTDPAADPHSYEVSPRDAARLTDADLIVYNGGGYDGFLDDVLRSTRDKRTVNAFELYGSESDLADGHDHAADPVAAAPVAAAPDSHDGHDHAHGAVNEHVWYDVPTVDAVAKQVATELGELDPANAAAYTANAAAYHEKLHAITAVTSSIAKNHPQAPVAQTEPIAHYLLAAADLHDKTPEDFTKAIEDGNDPPPAAIAATRDLLAAKKVGALVYNTQTQDKVTKDIRSAAEAAGIRVVEVTETLPTGVDYITWQTNNAEQLAAALGPAPLG